MPFLAEERSQKNTQTLEKKGWLQCFWLRLFHKHRAGTHPTGLAPRPWQVHFDGTPAATGHAFSRGWECSFADRGREMKDPMMDPMGLVYIWMLENHENQPVMVGKYNSSHGSYGYDSTRTLLVFVRTSYLG